MAARKVPQELINLSAQYCIASARKLLANSGRGDKRYREYLRGGAVGDQWRRPYIRAVAAALPIMRERERVTVDGVRLLYIAGNRWEVNADGLIDYVKPPRELIDGELTPYGKRRVEDLAAEFERGLDTEAR